MKKDKSLGGCLLVFLIVWMSSLLYWLCFDGSKGLFILFSVVAFFIVLAIDTPDDSHEDFNP